MSKQYHGPQWAYVRLLDTGQEVSKVVSRITNGTYKGQGGYFARFFHHEMAYTCFSPSLDDTCTWVQVDKEDETHGL